MTLEEAIFHCEEKSKDDSICDECKEEHKQLKNWLEELREYRQTKDKGGN